MKNRSLRSFFAMLVLLLPLPAAAQLAAAPALPSREPVRLSFIDGGAAGLGLQVKLATGWKFYWRTPGEGGVPPQFDWAGSRNLQAVQVAWPAPHRITIGDTDLFGYTDEVTLPLTVLPQNADAPVDLSLHIEYGVCKDICILRNDQLQHHVAAQLPEGATGDMRAAAELARWRAQVPRPADVVGIRLLSRGTREGRLVLVLASDVSLRQPDLLVEGAPADWFGRPVVTLSADRKQASIVLPAMPKTALTGPLTLTLIDGPLAAELKSPGL